MYVNVRGTSQTKQTKENCTMEVTFVEVPKKKRGRPAKRVEDLAAPELITPEQEAQFAEILKDVEASCPYQKDENGNYGLAGRGWVDDEVAKRKKALKNSAAIIKAGDDNVLDPSFVSDAKKSDKRIDKALQRGGESFFEAIKELVASGDKGYYKALGFSNFDKYRASKTEYSRSHIGQGMQVYKALHGKIDDEKLMALPLPTAVLLTKIPESKLTAEVIEAAESMTIQEFKEKEFPKHASQLVDGTTGEALPIPQEDFAWIPRLRVHSQISDLWKKFMDVARWKAAGLVDENDVYGNFTLDEKALLVIYMECKGSGWEDEYYNAKFPPATTEVTVEADEQPAF